MAKVKSRRVCPNSVMRGGAITWWRRQNKSRPSPSLTRFCNKDRNPPGGALLVFGVRRIRRNGKFPEPRSFSFVLDLARPHRSHHGLITNFNIRIDAQIVRPNRIRWCPALRSDEDVAIAVLNAHQWGLTDRTGLRFTGIHMRTLALQPEGEVKCPQPRWPPAWKLTH